ncbi:MauE/DoxX family redox-associated membrane protein [Streptomyces sp. A1277]|uniref:MauE/DoxX family redox-associated membrane protein n=1 Tax=Streptomyces sp. A1277 TaxID=2563103 RepID=UPI0014452047|nr:MauE/DoxX family redox-associated membrane protein [Streptomyces sp. A1277]
MYWIQFEAQLVLALVFTWSAAAKLFSPATFTTLKRSVAVLARVPGPWSSWAPHALVTAEAALAGGLLVPAAAKVSLALAILLLTVFTVVLRRAVSRAVPVPCGCFGPSNRPVGRVQLFRNAALLTIALSGLAAGMTAPPHGPVPVPVAGVALCLWAALTLAICFALWDEFAGLLAPAASGHR